MIFDVINTHVQAMKRLRRRIQIKEHQEQQRRTDEKYRALVKRVALISSAVYYAQDVLAFSVTEALQSDLVSLIENLRNAVHDGAADQECVVREEKHMQAIQTALKREWSKYYPVYTGATLKTLDIIHDINAAEVESCVSDLRAAKGWTADLPALTCLKSAKERAEKLIRSLGMSTDVEAFLAQMSSGQATLADLGADVLAWIQKEKLAGKIRLSFS